MKYKKSILLALTVIFASCGGGGGADVVADTLSKVGNGFLMMPVVY
jgi:hypothetical protein